MPRRKKKPPTDMEEVTPHFKNEIEHILKRVLNGINDSHTFSSQLRKSQRAYIHKQSQRLGLKSHSCGVEPNRVLTVCGSNRIFNKNFTVFFDKRINEMINSTITMYDKEEAHSMNESQPKNVIKRYGKLCGGRPTIPPSVRPNEFLEWRKQLPVWREKQKFLKMLNNNNVIILTSECGSGKTTQIPQFILENASITGIPCKVVCTQPRRLSTVAVAQRVAVERGERLGQTVGFQVKLESNVGINSSLIYCTNGVLLRTLMDRKEDVNNITHIIVDEIHERDRYTDFVLTSLKRHLHYYKKAPKIILMSATADIDLFKNYFDSAQVLNITGRLFDVKTYYKDEILRMVKSLENSRPNTAICNIQSSVNVIPSFDDPSELDEIQRDMNETISECLEYGSEDSFNQLLMLIISEQGDVNHQTPTGCSPLIVASIHGNTAVVAELLSLGADTKLIFSGKNALEWARNKEVSELLLSHEKNYSNKLTTCSEPVDYNLIITILSLIYCSGITRGSILIFLPGYDEILNCYQRISESSLIECFELFMLHSCMDIKTQHNVFNMIQNKQKVILSTNISETSITIPDVSYVIDSGLVKEKIHNFASGTCSLQTMYISKASAKQREGRAGRTIDGTCFRLYSKKQYDQMPEYNTPEILRTPLHELCLQIKLLGSQEKISAYLLQAVQPPPIASIENAVSTLIDIGALTEEETLTALGQHLVKFSTEPRLAKMLIYATIFKCIDPVLTIVACLDFKGDTFLLPQISTEKGRAKRKQQELSDNTLSDHLTLLRAFQKWQTGKVEHNKELIKEYYINTASMEIVHKTRSYLLSQLKAVGFITSNKGFDIRSANEHSHCWPIVKAVLALGGYPNVAFGYRERFATRVQKDVVFSKYSSISHFNPNKRCSERSSDFCVIYEELVRYGTKCIIQRATAISPLTIALVCGDEIKNFNKKIIEIDNLMFQHNYDNLQRFCSALSATVARIITDPCCTLTVGERTIMNTLHKILVTEEEAFTMFGNPPGLRDKPTLFLRRSLDRNNDIARNTSKDNKYSENCQNQFKSSKNVFTMGDIEHSLEQVHLRCDKGSIHNQHIYGESQTKTQHTPQDRLLNAISTNNTINIMKYNRTDKEPSQLYNIAQQLMTEERTQDTVFFIIKPSNSNYLLKDNLECSVPMKQVFVNYLMKKYHVLLFFVIPYRNEFQGVAQVIDDVYHTAQISIQWLSYFDLPYERIRTVVNPWELINGQQIDFAVGRQLYDMFFKRC